MRHLRLIIFLGLLVIIVIVMAATGYSSKATSADMSFLHNIPTAQSKQIDAVLSKVNFKFQEPKSIPFHVSFAQADLNEAFHVQHVQLMFVSNDKRAIVLTIENTETVMANVEVFHKQKTKLSDGTEAIYGNNGATSQLIWEKGKVTYSLVSSKSENGRSGSDLGMDGLIKIADSFK